MCIVPVIVIRYLCIVIYLFMLVFHHFHSFILFVVRLFIHSVVHFCSLLILLFSLFVMHSSKRKESILILDCVPGISILHTTSSMRVNKHTADCTDFVLVLERRTYYNHRYSGIDETNIKSHSSRGRDRYPICIGVRPTR
jgi:hypothetical protein